MARTCLEQTCCCVGDTKGSLWEVSKGRGVCRGRVQVCKELVNGLFLITPSQQLLLLQACRPHGCSPAVWSQREGAWRIRSLEVEKLSQT